MDGGRGWRVWLGALNWVINILTVGEENKYKGQIRCLYLVVGRKFSL